MRYTIGRFAGMFQISKKTLRNYQQIGLLLPEEVDPVNGYAYYGNDQFDRMEKIIYLRRLGFPLGEIGRLLDTCEPAWASPVKERLFAVRDKKRKLLRIERELVHVLDNIKKGRKVMEYMDSEKTLEASVFTLSEPIHVIGRGEMIPAGDMEKNMPLIEAVIDGFFGDGVPTTIPNHVTPTLRFCISGAYDKKTNKFLYMMGDKVTTLQEVPEGLRTYKLPTGLYAKFVFSAPDVETLVTTGLEEASNYVGPTQQATSSKPAS